MALAPTTGRGIDVEGKVGVEDAASATAAAAAVGPPETAPSAAATDLVRDRVEVRLPAAGAYLSVLRTATAGLAARLDFTIDEIEDLRIAVDEACAMLLPHSVPGSDLRCSFELNGTTMLVTVTVVTRSARLPSRDTFAWTVLTALAGDVGSAAAEGTDGTWLSSISLHKRRSGAVSG